MHAAPAPGAPRGPRPLHELGSPPGAPDRQLTRGDTHGHHLLHAPGRRHGRASARPRRRRSTGNAWLIGVVAGLAGAGIDLTEADVIIGTSAGATAAAQLTGTAPADLLAATLEPPPARAVTGAPRGRPSSGGIVADHLDRFRRIIGASQDAADMRRRMGAIGIELDDGSDGAATRRWPAIVAARLPDPRWPQRRVLLTAIDARTG